MEGCCHGEPDKVIGQLKERVEMAVDHQLADDLVTAVMLSESLTTVTN